MLEIKIPIGPEEFDDEKQEFVEPETVVLRLEHSLVSLSKWESKWKKAFLSNKKSKTYEEVLDYIKCMTLTPNVDPELYNLLTAENYKQIQDYIDDAMTATCLPQDKGGKKSNEVVTSELIYYWMIALNIPFDPCQYWHINRLLTLVQVCNIKNQPPKKSSKRDIMSRNAALNAARRKQLNSRG